MSAYVRVSLIVAVLILCTTGRVAAQQSDLGSAGLYLASTAAYGAGSVPIKGLGATMDLSLAFTPRFGFEMATTGLVTFARRTRFGSMMREGLWYSPRPDLLVDVGMTMLTPSYNGSLPEAMFMGAGPGVRWRHASRLLILSNIAFGKAMDFSILSTTPGEMQIPYLEDSFAINAFVGVGYALGP